MWGTLPEEPTKPGCGTRSTSCRFAKPHIPAARRALPFRQLPQDQPRRSDHEIAMLRESLLPRNAAFAALESEIGGQRVAVDIEQLCQFLGGYVRCGLHTF